MLEVIFRVSGFLSLVKVIVVGALVLFYIIVKI